MRDGKSIESQPFGVSEFQFSSWLPNPTRNMNVRANYRERSISGFDEPANNTQSTGADEPLVDAARLLEVLFEDGSSRPTLRWIRKMQSQRKIPYYKIGHLVRFRVSEVQEALSRKCHVRAA